MSRKHLEVPDCEQYSGPAEKDSLSKEGQEVANYVAAFIDKRFPNGLPVLLLPVVKEIIFDAFIDGMNWGEEIRGEHESKLIIPGH